MSHLNSKTCALDLDHQDHILPSNFKQFLKKKLNVFITPCELKQGGGLGGAGGDTCFLGMQKTLTSFKMFYIIFLV